MIRINCPLCGLRDETEFSYGGDATMVRPEHGDGDREKWFAFVFLRDNPRGAHREHWQHIHGCRQWLVVDRDTLTNEMGKTALARDVAQKASS